MISYEDQVLKLTLTAYQWKQILYVGYVLAYIVSIFGATFFAGYIGRGIWRRLVKRFISWEEKRTEQQVKQQKQSLEEEEQKEQEKANVVAALKCKRDKEAQEHLPGLWYKFYKQIQGNVTPPTRQTILREFVHRQKKNLPRLSIEEISVLQRLFRNGEVVEIIGPEMVALPGDECTKVEDPL